MDFLYRLWEAPGVSGYEDAAQEIVRQELNGCCNEVRRDRVGNLVGLKRATKKPADGTALRLMFAAHANEVGMMVRNIDVKYFIRSAPVGVLDPRALVSQKVKIHGSLEISGIIDTGLCA